MKKLLLPLVAALALGGYALPVQAEASPSSICAKKHGKKKARGKKKQPAQPQPNIPL
jgi:hypothetical protein